MKTLSIDELTPEQLAAFNAWLSQEEWEIFHRLANEEAERELSRAIRDHRQGESPDALFIDRERALAKLQIHRYYAGLKPLVSGMVSQLSQLSRRDKK